MGKTVEELVPDKAIIEVKGKKYAVEKMSARQTILLMREVVREIVKISTEDRSKLAVGKSNIDDILAFFDFINEDSVTKIVGIILDEQDISVLHPLGADELSEVIAVFCEQNDLGKIIKNVQRVMEATKKYQKPQKT